MAIVGRQSLTGRRRYRVDADGRVILQVEEHYPSTGFPGPPAYSTWRDARIEDLSVHRDDEVPAIDTRGVAA